jgi:hypothetical protein
MIFFRPKYIDLETQAENLTPEAFASFPSKEQAASRTLKDMLSRVGRFLIMLPLDISMYIIPKVPQER